MTKSSVNLSYLHLLHTLKQYLIKKIQECVEKNCSQDTIYKTVLNLPHNLNTF